MAIGITANRTAISHGDDLAYEEVGRGRRLGRYTRKTMMTTMRIGEFSNR